MGDKSTAAITVRVIDYQLPGVAEAEPVYRLITTLLDSGQYPADELTALYHERWSIETTFAEIKTTLKGAGVLLRRIMSAPLSVVLISAKVVSMLHRS